MRLPCIPNGENDGVFSLLFSRSHLTTKKVPTYRHIRVCHHECGRTIEEVRVRGRLRVREVRVHGFATVRDSSSSSFSSSSSSSSSSSLARAFFLARIFWTPLDGGKKKKKKKKRSTTNFRGWVGNREEEVKENENVPLDRRARARVRKRRSKVCSFGKNGKKRVPRSRHFLGGGGGVFSRVFFSPFLRSRRKDTKKNTTRSALKTTSANRTQTSLSLSLSLISLPADTIMRRILLPIDSTGEDVDVLKWVIENVHRAGDQIVLLHVYVSLFLFFFILLSRM